MARGPETGPDAAARRAFEDAVITDMLEHCAAEVWVTPSLYDLQDDDPLWAELRRIAARLTLCTWLYARAARVLLAARGIPEAVANSAPMVRFDLAQTPAECAAEVMARLPRGTPSVVRHFDDPLPPPRWYPMLDLTRCRRCGQCYEFCIFGVYERGPEREVLVTRPDNCKPGCPACARVCPFGAIIFARERRDPAIAGAGIADSASARTSDSTGQRPKRPTAPDGLDDLIRDLDALDL